MKATLHTDGGARGNPGPAAAGYVLQLSDELLIEHGEYIGETTNNQAEYTALIVGMERAVKEGVGELECFLDSELVVQQLNGKYRVKDEGLKPLYRKVEGLREEFVTISFVHVPRTRNKRADKLVNQALDAL